jgi:hypothetical protein
MTQRYDNAPVIRELVSAERTAALHNAPVTERGQEANGSTGRQLSPGERALVLLGLVSAFVLVVAHYYEWTGLRGKTLWDWADLLIVPLFIALFGLWFTRSENRSAQTIAGERAQDTMLQTYLDQMGGLLLNWGLRDVEDRESEVRRLARARTLTVVQTLGPGRKRSLLQFLWEADLIRGERPIISLYGADLSNADLSNMNLILTNLVGANLRGANLSGSSLSVLRGSGETLLRAAQLDVEVSTLMEPQSAAILRAADLRDAILRDTSLEGVDLWEADLSGADLSGARISQDQLDACKSLAGAIMPDGTRHD